MQILALDQFHGDELHALGLAEVVNPDHVAVGDLVGEDKLLFEAGQDLGTGGHIRPDDLQGHDPVQFAVAGLVHRAHPALAEEFENLVPVAQHAPDLQQDRARNRSVGA